jgi:hypothetical protein
MVVVLGRILAPLGGHNDRASALLGLEYVALIHPAASKEAVTHHLLAKEKHEADQDDQEKELYESQPGRLSRLRAGGV